MTDRVREGVVEHGLLEAFLPSLLRAVISGQDLLSFFDFYGKMAVPTQINHQAKCDGGQREEDQGEQGALFHDGRASMPQVTIPLILSASRLSNDPANTPATGPSCHLPPQPARRRVTRTDDGQTKQLRT